MIHSIPTPKLVIISNDGKQAQQNRRKVGNHGNELADFRWGFVEEFLRSRELSKNTKKAYTASNNPSCDLGQFNIFVLQDLTSFRRFRDFD